MIFHQGAVPIAKEGEIIGAVGVSGATAEQDEEVAKAGGSRDRVNARRRAEGGSSLGALRPYRTYHLNCATRRSSRPWRIVCGPSSDEPNVCIWVVTTRELSAL